MTRGGIMFSFTRMTLRIRRFPREWCYACDCDHALDRRLNRVMAQAREGRTTRPLAWGQKHGAA